MDGPSRRSDYEGESPYNTLLLPTLKYKLALETEIADGMRRRSDVGALVAAMIEITGLKQTTPRSNVKAMHETAYDDATKPVVDLIKDLQQRDAFVKNSRDDSTTALRRRKARSKNWTFDKQGILRNGNGIYVPGDEALRQELLSKCHNDPLAGHFGIDKTIDLIKRKYYWEGIPKDVKDYVSTCDLC